MTPLSATNDFVIKFANVNGSGSASANSLFAKSILRMGVPVAARNIFPSNIQGLPTWYEVRVCEAGWLGRRGGVDLMVAMNPQTWDRDLKEIEPGGYLIYDSTKPMPPSKFRDDITVVGIPLTAITNDAYAIPRERQLFKNIIYVGALATLLGIDLDVVEGLIADEYKSKPHLVPKNVEALHMGRDYAVQNLAPLGLQVRKADAVGDRIFVEGNAAAGLGAVYGGATVCAWYPITPSTSLAEGFEKYCKAFRVDPETKEKRYAIVQAEDEIASIGMVVGAGWNGARAFTCTSGPGVSLMQEFIGLSYFAEIPAVIFDVQRGGPSTGMPTRTQQSDLLSAAYASHGDTKHVMLLPQDPGECFEFGALAFDLADRLQTTVFVMLDLDIGMNDWLTEPFQWDDSRRLDRGKVMTAEELEAGKDFGRYLDVDGDGVPYRTWPGTHPSKGAYFTRGTSRDRYARYSEEGSVYVDNMERLLKKFATAAKIVPHAIEKKASTTRSSPHGGGGPPKAVKPTEGRLGEANGVYGSHRPQEPSPLGVIYFGSTSVAMDEALAQFAAHDVPLDALRIRAFPFGQEVWDFIDAHERVFVVEQNRDAQLRTLLTIEGDIDPAKLIKVLNYDGAPITARFITGRILELLNPAKSEAAE